MCQITRGYVQQISRVFINEEPGSKKNISHRYRSLLVAANKESVINLKVSHGLLTLPDPDSDTEYKPDGYIVICRTFHTTRSDSDSNFDWQLQKWDQNLWM